MKIAFRQRPLYNAIISERIWPFGRLPGDIFREKTGVCPRLAAFVSLARNDEVDITVPGRENWTPWISCVFTYPEYRGNSYAEKLIYHAEKFVVTEFNAEYTYISTDHIGLYEKYGYEFFTNCQTVWGEETRVLRKKMNLKWM